MKVLIVEPGKRPIKADIDHTLHNLQQVIGGYIQALPLGRSGGTRLR